MSRTYYIICRGDLMLSNDPIVRVAIYATAGATFPESFDTGLILSEVIPRL